MITFDRFHEGKRHILTMSYDDGTVYDRKLVEIFNRYGIRGSFHLNSGFFGKERYISADEVAGLYQGHEVSVHTLTHPHLEQVSPTNAVIQVLEDRKNLEALCGYPVRGMSYPFGTYNDSVLETLRQCGIVCSRTVRATKGFGLPGNFLEWHPTCHHRDALALADQFIKNFEAPFRIPLFYVWGHSYEFNDNNNWDLIEEFCKRLGGRGNIWYATNIEIYDYITAQHRLQISTDNKIIHNPSAQTVWVANDGETIEIKGGQTVRL